ncbi:MAG: TetR/AcrR family transcriptional regulator C-terminal domain-containing protein [Mycobacteriales bacterium]
MEPRPRLRPRLNRRRVLDAALHIVDSRGVDALTMRGLGQDLGCDPMALYRYAPNRAAVLDGVAETVLSRLQMPAESLDWGESLRSTGQDFRRLALAHPNVVPLIVTRPLTTPLGLRPLGTLRPLEQILGLLIGAGFAPDQALHAYRAYIGLLHGHILNELQELVADPEATDALLRLGIDRLPHQEFPHIRDLADALVAGYDGAVELDRGLDLLLDGLRAEQSRLPAPAPRRRTSSPHRP